MAIVTYSQLGKNGRLANQMYQIAATIAYAAEHGKDFVFPQWEYSKYMEKPLPIGYVQVDRMYNEPTFHYTPIPKMDGDVDLCGYYQSWRYFQKYWEHIRPYFTPNAETMASIADQLPMVRRSDTCSLHVRRGDYLKSPHLEYHGVLPVEYYAEAMKRVMASRIVVFSDDMEWCKAHLPRFSGRKLYFAQDNTNLQDLFLGALCHSHIIANSSFSAWQAMLGRWTGNEVYAPKAWFTSKAGLDTRDLYCPGWHII